MISPDDFLAFSFSAHIAIVSVVPQPLKADFVEFA